MKTIKFILNDDGSILDSSIGFQINQYSYNDTLINVYVPYEILDYPTRTETEEDDEHIVHVFTYSNSIAMNMLYEQRNGSYKKGTTYYYQWF